MAADKSTSRSVMLALLIVLLAHAADHRMKPLAITTRPVVENTAASRAVNLSSRRRIGSQDVMFYAKVISVRPSNSADRVIGATSAKDTHVAVLRVTRLHRGLDSRVAEGSELIVPIGYYQNVQFWSRLLSLNLATRFELFKLGNYEGIVPFGC